MTIIQQEDLVQSVADALQFISYYHPVDFIRSLAAPTSTSRLPPPRTPSRSCSSTRACAPKAIAPSARTPASSPSSSRSAWTSTDSTAPYAPRRDDQRRACAAPTCCRTTSCAPPSSPTRRARARIPATIPPPWSTSPSSRQQVDVIVAAKGGGSEAKSKFAMLNPSDSIVEWVLKTVPTMGAGWCPPGILGIGIGGTAEKAMLIAKEALMDPIDIQDLKARGAEQLAPKSCASNSTTRSTPSASERRASAASPRCST